MNTLQHACFERPNANRIKKDLNRKVTPEK